MTITMCPKCGKRFNAPDDGRTTRCPQCGKQFIPYGAPGSTVGKPKQEQPRYFDHPDVDLNSEKLREEKQFASINSALSQYNQNLTAGSTGLGSQTVEGFGNRPGKPGLFERAFSGEFDGSGDAPPGAGEPGGPSWLEETTDKTHRLLEEIRDAVREVSGGRGGGRFGAGVSGTSGSDHDDPRKYYTRTGGFGDISGILADKNPGDNQSASNLFTFARDIYSKYRRRVFGIGRQKAEAIVPATVGFPDLSQFGKRGGQGQQGGSGQQTETPNSRRQDGTVVPSTTYEEMIRARAEENEKKDSGKTILGGLFTAASRSARALGQVAAAALDAGKSVYTFAHAQEGEVRRLAQVGGTQAAAVAMLDVSRIKRDINTARETGDTSSGLTKSIDKFEEALRPFQSLATNIANVIAGGLLDMMTAVVDSLGGIAKDFATLLESLNLWKNDQKNRELKKLPAAQIESIVKEQESRDRPQWPEGPPGSPVRSTISRPFGRD